MNIVNNVAVNINRVNFKLTIMTILFILSGNVFSHSVDSCIGFDNYKEYKTDAWWISNVNLREQQYHNFLKSSIINNKNIEVKDDFYFSGHQLIKGNGNALIFKRFFKGWTGISDTSHLMQMTVFIPNDLKKQGKIKIDKNSDLVVFLIDGFPSFGDFCIGYAIEGTIEYELISSDNKDPSYNILLNALNISEGVKAIIGLKLLFNDSSQCKPCAFNADIFFNKNP